MQSAAPPGGSPEGTILDRLESVVGERQAIARLEPEGFVAELQIEEVAGRSGGRDEFDRPGPQLIRSGHQDDRRLLDEQDDLDTLFEFVSQEQSAEKSHGRGSPRYLPGGDLRSHIPARHGSVLNGACCALWALLGSPRSVASLACGWPAVKGQEMMRR